MLPIGRPPQVENEKVPLVVDGLGFAHGVALALLRARDDRRPIVESIQPILVVVAVVAVAVVLLVVVYFSSVQRTTI
jgi:hypothetical protein